MVYARFTNLEKGISGPEPPADINVTAARNKRYQRRRKAVCSEQRNAWRGMQRGAAGSVAWW